MVVIGMKLLNSHCCITIFPLYFCLKHIGLLAQWYSIDMMLPDSQFSWKTFGSHFSALIETCLSACITLLVHEPLGSLQLRSCTVNHLSDW